MKFPVVSRVVLRLNVGALLVGAACGRPSAADWATGAPPLHISGQRILLLPVQGMGAQDALQAELLFALRDRDPGLTWVSPDELRQTLQRAPQLAGDPAMLPADPLVHHGERRAGDALAAELRRLSALTDTRLVLLPRLVGGEPGQPEVFRAALLDTRTGRVIWWTQLDAPGATGSSRAELAAWAAELAQRLIASERAEVGG
jgi:hypothetical protein